MFNLPGGRIYGYISAYCIFTFDSWTFGGFNTTPTKHARYYTVSEKAGRRVLPTYEIETNVNTMPKILNAVLLSPISPSSPKIGEYITGGENGENAKSAF